MSDPVSEDLDGSALDPQFPPLASGQEQLGHQLPTRPLPISAPDRPHLSRPIQLVPSNASTSPYYVPRNVSRTRDASSSSSPARVPSPLPPPPPPRAGSSSSSTRPAKRSPAETPSDALSDGEIQDDGDQMSRLSTRRIRGRSPEREEERAWRIKRPRRNSADRKRDDAIAAATEAQVRLEEEKKRSARLDSDLRELRRQRQEREEQIEENRLKAAAQLDELQRELVQLRQAHYVPDYEDERVPPPITDAQIIKENVSAAAERAILAQDLELCQTQLEAARQSLDEAATRNMAAEERAAESVAREKTLAAEKLDWRSKQEELNANLAALREKAIKLSAENAACLRDLADSKEQQIEDIEKLRSTILDLTTENDTLVHHLERAEARRTEELAEKDRQIAALRSDQRDLQSARRALAESRADKAEVERRLESMRKRADDAEHDVSDLKASVSSLTMERDQANKEVEESHEQLADMRESRRKLSIERSDLARQLQNASSQDGEALRAARSTIAGLEQEKADRARQLAKVEAELVKAHNTVQAHETETNDLLRDLEVARAEESAILQQAQHDVASLSSERDVLAQQLQAALDKEQAKADESSAHRELTSDYSELASRFNNLYDESQAYLETIKKLEQQLKSAAVQHPMPASVGATEPAAKVWTSGDGKQRHSRAAADKSSRSLSVDTAVGSTARLLSEEAMEADHNEDGASLVMMVLKPADPEFQILDDFPAERLAPRNSWKKRPTSPLAAGSELKSHMLSLKQRLDAKDCEIGRITKLLDQATAAKQAAELARTQTTSHLEGVVSQYRQALDEEYEKSLKLSGDLQTLRKDRDTFSSLNERLVREKGQLADKLQELEDGLLYTKTPAEDLEDKVKDLEAKMNLARTNANRYKTERDGARADVMASRERVKTLERDAVAMKKRLDETKMQVEKDVDRKESVIAHQTIEAQAAELASKQAEIDRLVDEAAAIRAQLAATADHEAARAELDQEIAVLNDRIQRQADEVSTKQTSIDSLGSDNALLQSQLDAASKEYNTRMDEIRAENADELYGLSEKIENHQRELEQLQAQQSAAEKKASAAQEEADKATTEYASLASLVEGMREAAVTLTAELSAARTEKAELEEEAESLRAAQQPARETPADELALRQTSIDHLEAEVARLTSELEEASSRHLLQRVGAGIERKGLTERIDTLISRIEQHEREAAEAQKLLDIATVKAGSARDNAERLTAANEAMEAGMEGLREQARDTQRAEAEVQGRLRESVSKADTAQREVVRLTASNTALTSSVEEWRNKAEAGKKHEAEAATARELLKEAMSRLEATQRELGTLSASTAAAAVKKHEAEAVAAQGRLKDAMSKLEASQREVGTLTTTKRQLEMRITECRRKEEAASAEVSRLHTENAEVHASASKLATDISGLNAALSEKEKSIAWLNIEITQLRSKSADAADKRKSIVNGIVAERDNLAAEVTSLAAEIETHRQEKLDLHSKLEGAEKLAGQARRDADAAQAGHSRLTQLANEARQEADRLSDEMSSLRAEADRLERELADHKATISTQSQAAETHASEQAQQRTVVSSLETEVARLQAALESGSAKLVSERDAIITERDGLSSQIDSLKARLGASEREATAAKSQAQQSVAAMAKVQALADRYKTSNDSWCKTAETNRKTADDLMRGIRQLRAEKEALEKDLAAEMVQIAKREQEVEQAKHGYTQLQTHADALTKSSAQLRTDLEALLAERTGLLEQRTALEVEVARLSDSIREAQQPQTMEADKLRAEIAALTSTVEQREKAAKGLQSELDLARSERDKALEDIKAASASVPNLHSRIGTLQNTIAGWKADAAATQSKLDEAEKSRDTAQAEVTALSTQLESRADVESQLADLQKQLAVTEVTVTQAKAEVVKRDEEIARLKEEGTKLRAEAGTARDMIAEAKQAQSEAETLHNAQLASLKELREKVKASETTISARDITIATHMRSITERQIAVTKLAKELKEARSARDDLDAARQTLLRQVDELRQAEVRLRTEKERLEAAELAHWGEVEELRKAHRDAQDNGGAARETLQTEVAGLRKSLSAAEETVTKRDQRILSQETKLSASQETIEKLSEEAGKAKVETAQAAAKAEEARKAEEKVVARNVTLQDQLAQAKSLADGRQTTVEGLRKAAEAHHSDLSHKNRLIGEMGADIIRLQSELKAASRDSPTAAQLREQLDTLQTEKEAIAGQLAAAISKIATQQQELDAVTLQDLGRNINIDTLHDQISLLRSQLDGAIRDTHAAVQARETQSAEAETEFLRFSAWAKELGAAKSDLEKEVRELRLKDRRKFTAARLCAQLFGEEDAEMEEPEDPEWEYDADPWMDEVAARFREMAQHLQQATAERDGIVKVALGLEEDNKKLKDNLDKLDVFLSSKFPDYGQPEAPLTPDSGTGGFAGRRNATAGSSAQESSMITA